MLKRDLWAHWLRESDSELGIFHVLDLPPTRRSLQSERDKASKRNTFKQEDLLLALSLSLCRDLLVGGKSNIWKIPNSESDSLNQWAQRSRFNIGDSLVWEYSDSKDSVLQVTKRDYVTCNTSSPIQTYTGGNVNVNLDKSGPHYFISGAEGHCDKGQKLIVVVISPKHQRLSGVSPAPSPAEIEGPAVAPAPSGGFFMALVALLVVV